MASGARENLEFVENNFDEADQEVHDINKEDLLNNFYEYYPDGRIKRRRGPTRLANVENLPEGVKIIIKLDRFNAPVTKSAGVLGSYLGVLVKKPHLAPLNILKWNDAMFKEIYHHRLLAAVTRKFAIGERAKGWLINQLGDKWRKYKRSLKKKHYNADVPMEHIMANAPETVEETQWNTLVSHWYSEEAKSHIVLTNTMMDGQEINNQNKNNAKNIKYPHTLGRKSFARKRKELEDARGGEIDRATFFDECHKTKDGVYVNEATETKMNDVYMELDEKQLDGHTLTEADYEQAMKNAFGKDHSGRVRGMGPTVTPSKYFGGRFWSLSSEAETSSSSTQKAFMKFVLSYLAEKHPEDDLVSQLPPQLRRQLVGETQKRCLTPGNSPSTSKESHESVQD